MESISIVITQQDYNIALKRIEDLISTNPQEETAAYKELNSLGTMVSIYEEIHFPIDIAN